MLFVGTCTHIALRAGVGSWHGSPKEKAADGGARTKTKFCRRRRKINVFRGSTICTCRCESAGPCPYVCLYVCVSVRLSRALSFVGGTDSRSTTHLLACSLASMQPVAASSLTFFFTARRYATRGILRPCVCPSVRLPLTSRYCTKMAKYIGSRKQRRTTLVL